MGRRYLTIAQAEAALGRGKTVECFLEACWADGRQGVRHFAISHRKTGVSVSVFKTADLGCSAFLDLGEFGPLNSEVEYGDADQMLNFDRLETCWPDLETRWPGCTKKLVNEGIIQDEYADYVSHRGT